MDVIFDIDGTLADATHRLHWIKDPAYWVNGQDGVGPARPNWDMFLSDDLVAKDTPIPATWKILTGLLYGEHARIMFMTGRPERQRNVTYNWLTTPCEIRADAREYWRDHKPPVLCMRKDGDRRPSSVVKEEMLIRAETCWGFNPTLVFEDRKDDTEMWRRNGLLCCQVAEGNY